MKYIVEGWTITNRLSGKDGKVISDIMGGSGLYAFSAVRMCTDDCLFVSSVGSDVDDYYGKWFKDNNISKKGLFYQLDKTMYNDLKYFPDGSYIEYSIYGKHYTDEQLYDMRKSGLVFLGEEDPEEIKKQVVSAYNIAPFMDDAKGIYTCQDLNDEKNEIYLEHKKGGCKNMWEIPATSIEPFHQIYLKQGIAGLKHAMRCVDILSINRNECAIIFGVNKDKEIISLLHELDMPVYYRVGIDGAYMIVDRKDYFVPMISTVEADKEIDPTGCGNSSTGAVLWAWCEGYDPLMTCIIGNVVASYNVRQYGPYYDLSDETRSEMMSISNNLYNEYRGKYE